MKTSSILTGHHSIWMDFQPGTGHIQPKQRSMRGSYRATAPFRLAIIMTPLVSVKLLKPGLSPRCQKAWLSSVCCNSQVNPQASSLPFLEIKEASPSFGFHRSAKKSRAWTAFGEAAFLRTEVPAISSYQVCQSRKAFKAAIQIHPVAIAQRCHTPTEVSPFP